MKKSPFAVSLRKEQQAVIETISAEEPPSLPSASEFAWMYFMRLHQTRGQGGFGGFFAISYQEMKAFFDLEGTYPEPYELELIRLWDNIALKHLNKKKDDK